MRTAIVSDIHGNLTAFEAVLADLRHTSPDLVLHSGDLADGGSSPVKIIDRIRDLGWRGVVGNTDEMLTRPETFESFAAGLPALETLWRALQEMAVGVERLAWLVPKHPPGRPARSERLNRVSATRWSKYF